MTDYEIGYGRPPRKHRFKPGVSGNPKGRPKRQPSPLAESIKRLLDAPISYREHGRTMCSTYGDLAMRMLIDRAASGDVAAAKAVLKAYAQAERGGDLGADIIVIKNWIARALQDQAAPVQPPGPDGAEHDVR